MQSQVWENAGQHRFEIPIDGEAMAVAYYKIEDGRGRPDRYGSAGGFSGQGIASRLARGILELLRRRGPQGGPEMPLHGGIFRQASRITDVVEG